MIEALDAFRQVQFIGTHLIAATKGGIPEIGLFTVISLAIALTGAAYSVLLAFRDEYKVRIDSAIKNAPSLFGEIEDAPHERNYNKGDAAYKDFNKSIKKWKTRQLCPVIIFCLFVVVITIFVLLHKDPCNLQYPWWIFRISLSLVFVVDIISLLLVWKTKCNMLTHYNALLDAAQIVRDERKRRLRPTRRAELHPNQPQSNSTSISPKEPTTEPQADKAKKPKAEEQPE